MNREVIPGISFESAFYGFSGGRYTKLVKKNLEKK